QLPHGPQGLDAISRGCHAGPCTPVSTVQQPGFAAVGSPLLLLLGASLEVTSYRGTLILDQPCIVWEVEGGAAVSAQLPVLCGRAAGFAEPVAFVDFRLVRHDSPVSGGQ
ncbi:hypothetical protein, partial [Streptomyces sp. CB01883]|uniref:hypothetical protein n=1 Tax=Streptomyces sp. CB01883 TaxID=1703943 RepID=UPI001A7E0C72